jgi:Ca2+-binding EF-hand superfamily protein
VKTHIVAASVAAMLAGLAGAAHAQPTNVVIGVIKADVNGDLMLSRAEVILDAMRGFTVSDLDGDGLLEANEIGHLADHEEFADNDADKDGALSVEEIVAEKLADFAAMDTDGDGLLSIEELEVVYAGQE